MQSIHMHFSHMIYSQFDITKTLYSNFLDGKLVAQYSEKFAAFVQI